MMQNTLNWYNGEIFEAKFILGFGLILIISSLLFYFLGSTPTSKALLIPLIVVGLFFTATGANMIYSNGKKLAEVEQVYKQNNKAFVEAEIKRVEGFQYLYPLSIGISAVSFIVALSVLYFSKNVNLQAIAMALILFGACFAFIDYFSKERSIIYYEQLQRM
jgi:hypothetical protein